MATKPAKVPRLTATNVLKVVEGVGDWRRLGRCLWIPDSTLDDIDQQHSDDRGRMEAIISHWLKIDPSPSWRRLIRALDEAWQQQTADSIRQYAEPLTDPTLTFNTVTTAVAPVWDWNNLGNCLGVPWAIRQQIMSLYITDDKRIKEAVMGYWIAYCPGVSWGELAGWLHYRGEKRSLQHVQTYLKETTEPTITLPNLCQALTEVEDLVDLGEGLCVPKSKREETIQKYHDNVVAKREILQHFLTAHPAPSWRVVFEGLYQGGRYEAKWHTILQEVRRCYGREMVLPSRLLDTREVQTLRSTQSSTVAPLIIHFSDSPLAEMYVSVVNFLLSSENCFPYTWAIHCRAKSPPTCLYQNCIKFTIPNYAGSVVLINSSLYFEAHVNAPDAEYCGFVRDAIFIGLKNFSAGEVVDLSHSRPLPELAFICPCKVGSTHAATVGANQKWICVNDSEIYGKLQSNQRVWLTGPDQPTSSAAYARVADNCEEIVRFLSKNTDPEGLAALLEGKGLINEDIKDIAHVQSRTKLERIRPMIDAVISKIELNVENFDKFIEVLRMVGGLDELIELIT